MSKLEDLFERHALRDEVEDGFDLHSRTPREGSQSSLLDAEREGRAHVLNGNDTGEDLTLHASEGGANESRTVDETDRAVPEDRLHPPREGVSAEGRERSGDDDPPAGSWSFLVSSKRERPCDRGER